MKTPHLVKNKLNILALNPLIHTLKLSGLLGSFQSIREIFL